MRAEITPGRLKGRITIPASKSVAHRMLILAALSEGQGIIRNVPRNEDILATADCLSAFGCRVDFGGENVRIERKIGKAPDRGKRILPCRESGSTLRFLLPLALDGVPTLFQGSEKLLSRPLSVYEELCRREGFVWERSAGGLLVCGKLRSGEYAVPGNISSQFITGLLLALPFLQGDSVVELTGEVESRPYIEMTLEILQKFGISVLQKHPNRYEIAGNQKGKMPGELLVPGDESGAAFFGALNALGSDLTLEGLAEKGSQGDAVWRSCFAKISEGTPTLSIRDCPDLGPILAVMAACRNGAVLTDTARLRLKESDRSLAIREELKKFGVDIAAEENRMVIPGGGLKKPQLPLNGHNDHRIVMSLAVAALRTGGVLDGAEAVGKSMPSFWRLLQSAGAEIDLTEEEA